MGVAAMDDSNATPGILRRINSPNKHNNRIIAPVIKLLANATCQASSWHSRLLEPLVSRMQLLYTGNIIPKTNATN
ncbi:unnamed protein product [Rotaria magnacalcarata]|uniref:Uncharacterized protein n=1 Tax=Rotaria magnacalcarata TaxID=392030 RepID=A0A8S2RXP7_9BILA|nr:unnamed protein product [Rotaria magnacalcarata]